MFPTAMQPPSGRQQAALAKITLRASEGGAFAPRVLAPHSRDERTTILKPKALYLVFRCQGKLCTFFFAG
jgi:hypothetical protein